jgi:hypothetical protein
MKIRINNIECRKYTSTKVDKVFYEIIKWSANPHFGKEQEYRDKGYVDSFGGDFLQSPTGGHNIQKIFFEKPESCYMIASLHLNKREPDVELKSVGSRLLDLTKNEKSDFFEVYEIANPKIQKKHFKNL